MNPRNQILKDFNEHEAYKNRLRKMTPLNTLKIRGLDNEASRCISSVSLNNNKLTNQSFSEKSVIKKTEDLSMEVKSKLNHGNKSFVPISHLKKKDGLGDFILHSKPNLKNKSSKIKNENSEILKTKHEEIEVKGTNKEIIPKIIPKTLD